MPQYSLAAPSDDLALTRRLSVKVMYTGFWLASSTDSLYNGSGKAIARSATGVAGRHVGEEGDVFATYRYRHFQIGAGYGYLAAGAFLRSTTPGASPSYVYMFHTYSL